MFDLDTAIAEWRRQMRAGGVTSVEALDELEGHLRDDVGEQMAGDSGGVSAMAAFDSSVGRLGQPSALRMEFAKVGAAGTSRERIKRAFLTLAGIPNSYLNTDMNTPTSINCTEPRWATYTKAAVFIAPAISLWTLSILFLIPKLHKICSEIGMVMPSIYRATEFVADYLPVIIGAVIVLLVALERRWTRWPQYRRASVGGTVFVLNAAVLTLITHMVMLALIAAPHLMHHAR